MASLRQRAFVPVLLFLGAVVSVVSSLGAPLIPSLAHDLGVSLSSAQWALTATLVVAAVSSPLIGRLGDGRHRRRVIITAQSAVVLGGVFAAEADSLGLLITGRALQGFGLALMPLTMAAAREHLPAEQAGRTIAALSVVGAAGVGLGYPITGFIADHGGVSAAYWFGTAVSALALALAIWAVPEPQHAPAEQHLDLPGAALIGAGLVALLVGLDTGPDWGWGTPRVLLLIAAGLTVIGIWAWHELRTEHPLVDLRLVRHRAVLTANVSGLLLGVTMYLSMVIITQFVQLTSFGFGETVFVAGLTLLPLSILSSSVSRTLPWLQGRIGQRPLIPVGALFVSGGALFFAATASAPWQAFVTMGLMGIGLGYTFAAMPGLIVSAVPREETGSAMGFYQVSRFVGFALGSGLAITFLRGLGDAGVPTLDSYRLTAVIGAGLGLLTALIAWYLPGRETNATSARRGADQRDLEAYEIQEGELTTAGLEDRPWPAAAASGSGRRRHTLHAANGDRARAPGVQRPR